MKNLDFKKSGIEVLSSKEKSNINGGDLGLTAIIVIVVLVIGAAIAHSPNDNQDANWGPFGGGQSNVQDGL